MTYSGDPKSNREYEEKKEERGGGIKIQWVRKNERSIKKKDSLSV